MENLEGTKKHNMRGIAFRGITILTKRLQQVCRSQGRCEGQVKYIVNSSYA